MKAKSTAQIKARYDAIRTAYQPFLGDRYRIRAIMNGGEAGIKALLGDKVNIHSNDIPALNTFLSGVTRLGHTLGKVPDVKCDTPPNTRGLTKEQQQEAADKRGRIVKNYDRYRLGKQMRQHARWLPGYGYAVWAITEYEDFEGNLYPLSESLDPYHTYPGFWSHTEPPTEMYSRRVIPESVLKEKYGITVQNTNNTFRIANTTYGTDGYFHGVEVIYYYDEYYTYVYVPTADVVIRQVENPLTSGPKFEVAQRTSFDMLRGQYDDAIGLLAMFAKLNVLTMISTEEAVFGETNIHGGLRNVKYHRGRGAINHLPRDAKVEKPRNDFPQHALTQLNNIEQQLRTATQYPVTEDGRSPISFVTGEGISRLNQPNDRTIEEYQDILKESLEAIDIRRLEWDYKMYPDITKPMHSEVDGKGFVEEYTPKKDIALEWRTRREFGVMAGLDDPTKIVAALQMFQAGVVDLDFVRENIRGLGDLDRIRDGARRDRAEESLFVSLEMAASQGDPTAKMVLAEIFANPDKAGETLLKFYTPQEPQMSPEEELMQQGIQGGQGQSPIGPPPDAQTVLTQLGQNGELRGGVQTVGRF